MVSAHYYSWARDCLVDDITAHVHEVSRENFQPLDRDKFNVLPGYIASQDCAEALQALEEAEAIAAAGAGGGESAASPRTNGGKVNEFGFALSEIGRTAE